MKRKLFSPLMVGDGDEGTDVGSVGFYGGAFRKLQIHAVMV